MINQIANLPEVSFIDNMTLDDVQARLVKAYQDKYKELTGKPLTLQRADSESLKLYAVSVVLFQMFLHVDNAGKMDLLKYAYGAFLDNLGALRGVTRLPAAAAVCTVRFTLSAAQASVVTVPAGTMVTNGDGVYFETDEEAEIAAGNLYVDIPCTCTVSGAEGNNILAGAIDILVNPIPYMAFVANIDATTGGADVESDDDFADRIYLAPSAYSVAGPEGAYVFHVQSYSSSIGDVEVTSPTPCEVEVRFLLNDGTLPTQTLLDEVCAYLDEESIRPLTDHVEVLAPTQQPFDIDVEYYINQSDAGKASTIQGEVAAAIEEYVEWQTFKIGRDINPDVLTQKMIDAGAKRVVVASPSFTEVPSGSVARIGTQSVAYKGIEAD